MGSGILSYLWSRVMIVGENVGRKMKNGLLKQ